MRKFAAAFVFLLFCVGISMAQHGTAENDYYPMGYNGDTWTGEVTAVNEDTREFTLTYKKKDKVETFVGILAKGYKVKMKDGSNYEIKMSDIMGFQIKAYYIHKTKKVNDQKIETNEVFKIKFITKN